MAELLGCGLARNKTTWSSSPQTRTQKETMSGSAGVVLLAPGDVAKLVTLITGLINLDQSQETEIADLQSQVNVLTNEVAGFNDPALNSSVQAAITAATNALPPASTPPASTSTPPASTPPASTDTPASPESTPPATS